MKSRINGRLLHLPVWFALFTTFSLTTYRVMAQVELIGTAGSSQFLGDLGGKASSGSLNISDLNLPSTRYTLGGGARVYIGNTFALRSGVYYARLSAADKYTSNPERRNRNLSFFSPIYAGNLIAEVHLLPSIDGFKRLYVFSGIEWFHFDPRTKYNGQTVRLQPLGTEGQYFMPGRSPYKLSSLAIPFGVGYNFLRRPNGYWSFEVSARKTYTDYIDDVSTTYVDKTQLLASNGQMAVDLSDRSLGEIPGFSNPGAIRGHPNHNDNFFFLTISYNYVLGANGGHSNGFTKSSKRRQRCFQF